MRRTLVMAVAIALASLATPTSYLSSGDVAAAEKRDDCPGRLGSLRLASSSVDEEDANKGEVRCLYRSKDYSKNVVIRVAWLVKSASPVWLSDLEQTYCLRTEEDYVGPGQHGDKTRWGYTFPHAGDLYILAGYLATEKGPSVGRIRKVGRALVSQHAGFAATCPGAAEPGSIIDDSPSNVADSADADDDVPAVDSGTTTIVLSGGPDEEPPSVGTTIEVPEDDQHQLVVGGPDGEVIREEFIGDQATISAYGPLVTDADDNWSVLVTVDVTTAPEPTSLSSPGPSPTPTPAAMPELTPTPIPDTPSADPTTAPATSSPTEMPAVESPPTAPTEAPGPTASPTAVPPPELIGVPPGIAAIVAKLSPAGAGAVRDVSDHVAVLGELLETEQSGNVTVPASDIGSLRELLPDLVQEVWLTDGSMVVSTTNPDIGSILVKPVIGDDGLISVTLSQYQLATYHPVVRALVAALNGYVAERGGRFTGVSITPEGLTVTAERAPRE